MRPGGIARLTRRQAACGDVTGGCGPVTATYDDAATCDGMPVGMGVDVALDLCTSIADSADLAAGLSLSPI